MPGDGFIKLYRKLQSSQMYKALNSKQRDVMIQCLLLANHSGKEWEWQGEIVKCCPGQFVTSLESLKKKCASDVKIQSVRTALLKLEKWHFLTNESTKRGRFITIVNWGSYQGGKEDQQTEQQTANKQLTTNKNVKECKRTNTHSRVVDYLNRKTNSNFKPETKKTQNLINARLKEGFEPEDFKAVIDFKCDQWFTDDEKHEFLRPQTLFSNKFESYLNAAKRQNGNNNHNPEEVLKKYGYYSEKQS